MSRKQKNGKDLKIIKALKIVTHILHTIFCGVAKLISLFVIK
jgi:hypothetical protein